MQHRPHRVEHTIEIDRSLEQVYDALFHIENYPDFIPNLRIEHKGDEDVWQWTLQGPQEIAWDMKMDGFRHENRSISWHTIRMADVAHNGAITLEPLDENKTRLHFVVEYEPSAYFYQVSMGTKEPTFNDDQFVEQADQAIIRALGNFQNSVLAEQSTVKPGGGGCCS
jgi:uncharacterized membrane protein